jgi:PAS domain S-box-containing protein
METVAPPIEERSLRSQPHWIAAPPDAKLLLIALLVSVGYYAGARLGFVLTLQPSPVSILWPPNSILTAALLLTAPRHWWLFLVAAFPAHWLAQVQSDVPTAMILCWFISNCSEALMGAGIMRYLSPRPLRFDNLREVSIFCIAVAFIGPFLSSFIDAGFVAWNGWGAQGYWEVWRTRFTSNILAALTIIPLVVTWATRIRALRALRPLQQIEGLVIVFALTCIGFLVLDHMDSGVERAFLYLPLPFLLWATVRFGALGASTAIAIVAVSAILGAVHGQGPFSAASSHQNALSIQLFLFVMGVPLLFLAALVEERTAAAAKLRESEERYREIVESQTELVCRYLPDTTLTFVNDAYCRFFGRPRKELIGRRFLELIPQAARASVIGSLASLTAGRTTMTHEHQVVMPNGGIGWQEWTNHALTGPDGRTGELQGIGRDISERVRVTRALEEREERISLASESANLGLWVCQPETDTVWMSEKGREIYGLGREEPLSLESLVRCVTADERDMVRDAFAAKRSEPPALEIEHRIQKSNGQVSWVITRGRFLYDEHGKLAELIGATIDVTAQKQTALELQTHREDIAHLGRIAAMGEIAVSLAHELTQPLTGIMGNADAGRRLLRKGKPDLEEIRDILNDIKSDVSRARGVVQGIRGLGKKGKTVRVPVQLNDVIRKVARLVKPEANLHGCELRTALDSGLPEVLGDPDELQQVLVNLVVNSLDAMRQTPRHERRVTISTASIGHGSIQVSVQDRGLGISEDAQTQLFEKFFTTKSKGLGMGLAITRSIIQAHGGTISGSNAPVGGAVFTFVLPVNAAVS